MPHEHGFEYQVRIVYEDESEKLSGWMSCPEEAAHWISGPRRRQAKAYWLQVQDILCLNCRNCLNTGATIIEFPLAVIAVAKTRFPQQTESRDGHEQSRAAIERAGINFAERG